MNEMKKKLVYKMKVATVDKPVIQPKQSSDFFTLALQAYRDKKALTTSK